MKIALFYITLLNIVNSGDGLAKSRNMWLLFYYNKYNGFRWSVVQQLLLTCIHSREGPLCNKMFHCCKLYSTCLTFA